MMEFYILIEKNTKIKKIYIFRTEMQQSGSISFYYMVIKFLLKHFFISYDQSISFIYMLGFHL